MKFGMFTRGFKATKRYQIFKRDGWKCLCCGKADPEQLTIDHIVPLSLGKDNSAKNLQTLCRECNQKKAATEIKYAREKQKGKKMA